MGILSSIVQRGLIPGGLQEQGGRHEVFFSGADPWLGTDPLSKLTKYPFKRDVVVIVDTQKAEEKDANFTTPTVEQYSVDRRSHLHALSKSGITITKS